MQRVRLIVQAFRWNRPLENRLQSMRRSGLNIDWKVTQSVQETEQASREAAHEGIDTVMAGGGDGMVRLVASALIHEAPQVDSLPSMAILPLGTANDFASACGLSPEAWVQALHSPWYIAPQTVDLWEIKNTEFQQSFVNMCTGGTVATIPRDTSMSLKRLLGSHAYALVAATRLPRLQKLELDIQAPEHNWQGTAYGLILGNCRTAGGGLELCPGACINDGLLDIVLVTRLPKFHEVPSILGRLLKQGVGALPEFVTHFQVSELKLEAVKPLALETDGDALAAQQNFVVRPHTQKLDMHVLNYK